MRTKVSERERQRRKSAALAAAERNITIGKPKSLTRRRDCLADPFLFLKTYFAHIFFQPFTDDRREMVEAIIHAATYSGDFALAGPRGEGKTKLATFTALFLILNRRLKLPLIIGKNQAGCENELSNLKRELVANEMLAADFPEVCMPLIALDGWASRANKQTVNEAKTHISWARDYIIFPTIDQSALGPKWPKGEPSLACGQGIAVVGIDGKIRGYNRRNIRPDLAIIDDIDDRESARSLVQTADFQVAIEQDIAGLAGSGQRVARVMLCTTINRRCIAFQYTDRKTKPGWQGKRFRLLAKLPEREDLWAEYIELRRNRDADNDPDARRAHRFYIEHRADMDSGAIVSNPAAFENKPAADGEPLEVSALQAAYNKIADTSWEAFSTEYSNDPPADEQLTKAGISRELIRGRLSGFHRGELPPDCIITVGIDVGKTFCHWVAGAFRKGGVANIVQYGIIEVAGAEETQQGEIIERAILRALIDWKDGLAANPFRNGSGNPVEVSKVLIDSGYCSDAVCEFVRRYGEPYRATKGIGGNFRHGISDRNRRVGNHWFAQPAGGVWLYSLNADHWKRAVHERFIAEPMDANNLPNPGSLTLFIPVGSRDHHTFAQHIVAEEWVTEFIPGKGEKSRWVNHSANNHYLDATALCLAGAEMAGFGVFDAPKRKMLPPGQRMNLADFGKRRS